MKSDWRLPAIHFGYGRKGLKAPRYRRSLLFFTALRRQGNVRFAQTCAVQYRMSALGQ